MLSLAPGNAKRNLNLYDRELVPASTSVVWSREWTTLRKDRGSGRQIITAEWKVAAPHASSVSDRWRGHMNECQPVELDVVGQDAHWTAGQGAALFN